MRRREVEEHHVDREDGAQSGKGRERRFANCLCVTRGTSGFRAGQRAGPAWPWKRWVAPVGSGRRRGTEIRAGLLQDQTRRQGDKFLIAAEILGQGVTRVPRGSPATTRVMLPCSRMEKTIMGMWLSRQSDTAVVSMTLRLSRRIWL